MIRLELQGGGAVRICLVSLHPRLLSGQINSLVGLTRALRQRGHHVELLTPFDEARLLEVDRCFGEEARAGILLARVPRIMRVISRLCAAARSADIVHLNLPTPSFSWMGDVVQSLLGRPIVVGFEAQLASPGELIGPEVLRAPGFFLPQILVNNATLAHLSRFQAGRYVVASYLQAAELQRLGAHPERISVIPNLIDQEHLELTNGLANLDWPNVSPVICYVGHFNYVKGVDILIRAMPDVIAHCPTVQLVLAWSGLGRWEPIRSAIAETGVADHVRVLGRVPVASVLRRSDVCVLPYRMTVGQAAFPELILEAFTVGVPLVTTDLPLIRELVAPLGGATLALPSDPADLARQIISLLEDSELGRVMVARQHRIMATTCNREAIVDRFEAAYSLSTVASGRP